MPPVSNGQAGNPASNYLTDKGVTFRNLGISGQTTQSMINNATDVENAYVDGEKNILVLWEGTNSICNAGDTAAQAIQAMTTYIAARRASKQWAFILLLTCLPRQRSTQADTLAKNAALDSYNATVLSSYKDMGATHVVDVRQVGSPFNMPDYNLQTFEDMAASTGLWAANEVGAHVHLDAGYGVIAQMVAAELRRLPVSARTT